MYFARNPHMYAKEKSIKKSGAPFGNSALFGYIKMRYLGLEINSSLF